MRELWTCPKCGNRLVTRNMWHSCGVFSLDELFAKSEHNVRAAYDALETMARSLGDVVVIPQKSRVVFQTRTRFGGGVPKRCHFDASFIFYRRHASPRFHKVEDLAGKWFGHHARLFGPDDVDDEVREWLLEALRYGDQAGPRTDGRD